MISLELRKGDVEGFFHLDVQVDNTNVNYGLIAPEDLASILKDLSVDVSKAQQQVEESLTEDE